MGGARGSTIGIHRVSGFSLDEINIFQASETLRCKLEEKRRKKIWS